MKKKRIIILGSTGSIGQSALDVVRCTPDRFDVIGLTANANAAELKKQIKEFSPEYAVIADETKVSQLSGSSARVLYGENGLCELAGQESDVVVVGITGLAALAPVVSAIGRTKRIVLANKEAVVSAGDLIMNLIRRSDTELYPVDSEAWGVYRLLAGMDRSNIEKITITASGGPFFFKDADAMKKASVSDVLAHPVWDMGARITVDSASFMNKGLEIIEIHRLFGLELDKIDVLVHPQSAVHALLQTKDGALSAAMFDADMRIPIGHGMCDPEVYSGAGRLDLSDLGKLEFYSPDHKRFPFLKLAYKAAQRGGNIPTVLAAVDEAVVNKFLNGEIAFLDIYEIVRSVVDAVDFAQITSIEDVYYWNDKAYELAENIMNGVL